MRLLRAAVVETEVEHVRHIIVVGSAVREIWASHLVPEYTTRSVRRRETRSQAALVAVDAISKWATDGRIGFAAAIEVRILTIGVSETQPPGPAARAAGHVIADVLGDSGVAYIVDAVPFDRRIDDDLVACKRWFLRIPGGDNHLVPRPVRREADPAGDVTQAGCVHGA